VPGTHEVTYENEIDKISIAHEAKNRNGFALGAVIAAEQIVGKKGVYSMSDIIKF
jgi:4-hydroxy-tetrahydrodipicolinate reductase